MQRAGGVRLLEAGQARGAGSCQAEISVAWSPRDPGYPEVGETGEAGEGLRGWQFHFFALNTLNCGPAPVASSLCDLPSP